MGERAASITFTCVIPSLFLSLSLSLALLVSRALVLQLLQHKFNLEDYLFLSSPQGPENLFYETAALI